MREEAIECEKTTGMFSWKNQLDYFFTLKISGNILVKVQNLDRDI